MNNDIHNLGTGDFTVESAVTVTTEEVICGIRFHAVTTYSDATQANLISRTLRSVDVQADLAKEAAEQAKWSHFELTREISKATVSVHDDEIIDGQLFVRKSIYNSQNELVERHLIRADRVKA